MPQSLPRPDDPSTRRRAMLASGQPHQVLLAAGAWLRGIDEEERSEAREALAELSVDEVRGALVAIDPAICADALARATEAAFDASLEDDEEERDALETAAIEALDERDDVESILCAVDCVVDRIAADDPEAASLREAASALRATTVAVDAAAMRRARPLTAINELRRGRIEALAPDARAAAWWFGHLAGADHDGLMDALATTGAEAGPAASREAARAVLAPRPDAFAAALRALEDTPGEGPADRWASAEAARAEHDAIALRLARELRVESIDDAAIDDR
jgi:hypothetical protein